MIVSTLDLKTSKLVSESSRTSGLVDPIYVFKKPHFFLCGLPSKELSDFFFLQFQNGCQFQLDLLISASSLLFPLREAGFAFSGCVCVCVFFLLFEVSFFKSRTNLSSSYWPELCHVPIPKPVISNRGIVVPTKIIRLISGVENGVKLPLEEIQALWKGCDP